MAAAIGVRTDDTSADLRRLARRCGDADQVRRMLALAVVLDGGSRSGAARVAGVTLQIVRHWVLRFNEDGPQGLATRRAPGKASILDEEQRDGRGWADPSRPWCRALAACRSGAMDIG